MGANLSKKVIPQDTEAMQHYCQSVMTRSEIEQWRQFWTSLYPSGVATRDNFDSFAKIASLTYSTTGVDLMFRLLDTNRDGKITFLEFLWFEALHGRQSYVDPDDEFSKERRLGHLIDQAFLLYDANGDGKLSRQEMRETMINCLKLGGAEIDARKQEEIEQKIDTIFQLAEKSEKESLTKSELLEVTRADSSLLSML